MDIPVLYKIETTWNPFLFSAAVCDGVISQRGLVQTWPQFWVPTRIWENWSWETMMCTIQGWSCFALVFRTHDAHCRNWGKLKSNSSEKSQWNNSLLVSFINQGFAMHILQLIWDLFSVFFPHYSFFSGLNKHKCCFCFSFLFSLCGDFSLILLLLQINCVKELFGCGLKSLALKCKMWHAFVVGS